jgi:hypothetical protein
MRNLLYPAVEGVGKTVLVVKGDQVIGKGRVVAARGNEWVSVELIEGEVIELTKELSGVKELGSRWATFRYLPLTGSYFSCTIQDDNDAAEDILGETAIVDEFNFRYGLSPERFSKVPGYASALEGQSA